MNGSFLSRDSEDRSSPAMDRGRRLVEEILSWPEGPDKEAALRFNRVELAPPAGTNVFRGPLPESCEIAARETPESPPGTVLAGSHGFWDRPVRVEVAVPPALHPETREDFLAGWGRLIRNPAGANFFPERLYRTLISMEDELVRRIRTAPEEAPTLAERIRKLRAEHPRVLDPALTSGMRPVLVRVTGGAEGGVEVVRGWKLRDGIEVPDLVLVRRGGVDSGPISELAGILDVNRDVLSSLGEAELLARSGYPELVTELIPPSLEALREAFASAGPERRARAEGALRALEERLGVVSRPMAPGEIRPGDLLSWDVRLEAEDRPVECGVFPCRIGSRVAKGSEGLFTVRLPAEVSVLARHLPGFTDSLRKALKKTDLDWERALAAVLGERLWEVGGGEEARRDVEAALSGIAGRHLGIGAILLGSPEGLLERERVSAGRLVQVSSFSGSPVGQLLAFRMAGDVLEVTRSRGPRPPDWGAVRELREGLASELMRPELLRRPEDPETRRRRALAWSRIPVDPRLRERAYRDLGLVERHAEAPGAEEAHERLEGVFDFVWTVDGSRGEEAPAWFLDGAAVVPGRIRVPSDPPGTAAGIVADLCPGLRDRLLSIRRAEGSLRRRREAEERFVVESAGESVPAFVRKLNRGLFGSLGEFPGPWRDHCLRCLLEAIRAERSGRLRTMFEAVGALVSRGATLPAPEWAALARWLAEETGARWTEREEYLLGLLARAAERMSAEDLRGPVRRILMNWKGPGSPSDGLRRLARGVWGVEPSEEERHAMVLRVYDAGPPPGRAGRWSWVGPRGVLVRGLILKRRSGSRIQTVMAAVQDFLRLWEEGEEIHARLLMEAAGLALPVEIPHVDRPGIFSRSLGSLRRAEEGRYPADAGLVAEAINEVLLDLGRLVGELVQQGDGRARPVQAVDEALLRLLLKEAFREVGLDLLHPSKEERLGKVPRVGDEPLGAQEARYARGPGVDGMVGKLAAVTGLRFRRGAERFGKYGELVYAKPLGA